jgi:hypothetical protein
MFVIRMLNRWQFAISAFVLQCWVFDVFVVSFNWRLRVVSFSIRSCNTERLLDSLANVMLTRVGQTGGGGRLKISASTTPPTQEFAVVAVRENVVL